MGKGDTPPKRQSPDDGERVRNIEVQDGEQSSSSEWGEGWYEQLFPGDEVVFDFGESGKVYYLLRDNAKDDEGEDAFVTEVTSVNSEGRRATWTKNYRSSQLREQFGEYSQKSQVSLGKAGEDRYIHRYSARSLDDALKTAREARNYVEDGSMDARKVDADIRAMRAILAEQNSSQQTKNESNPQPNTKPDNVQPNQKGHQQAKKASNPNEKNRGANSRESGQPRPEQQANKNKQRESPHDKIARLRKELNQLPDQNSPEAWVLKGRIQELKAWIAADNERNRATRANTANTDKIDAIAQSLPGFAEKSPEAQQLIREMISSLVALGVIKPEAQANAPANRETEEQRRQKEERKRVAEEKRQAKIAELRQEIEAAYAAPMKDAMDTYAVRQADFETKWSPLGRSKREALLKDAEAALAKAKINQAKALIEKIREAGLYDGFGTARERGQRVSDDMFDEMRMLDAAKRQRTNEVIQQRIEDRNILQRFGASIGRFLNKRRRLTKMGIGAVPGVGVGAATAVAGLWGGLNVVGAAAAGVTAYGASRAASVEDILAKHRTTEGDAKETLQLNDEQRTEIGDSWKDGSPNLDEIGKRYTSKLFAASRERAKADRKEAHKKAFETAGAVGGGFILGTAAGALAGKLATGTLNLPNPLGGEAHSAGESEIPKGPESDHGSSIADGNRGADVTNGSRGAEQFAMYNTNGAPEHLFQNLTGTKGVSSERLFHDIAKEIGGYDNLFVNRNGSVVDLKDFGGSIDIGFTEWNQNNSARLSDAARAALARRGYTV